MATRITSALILLLIFHGLFILSHSTDQEPVPLQGIDVGHPTIDVSLTPIYGSSQGSKDVPQSCERVLVHGISRIKLQSYAKAYKVMVVPSVVIPDKWHNKIQVCFHRNASLGLCQCEKDDWGSVYKGLWSSNMSPYEQRFVDVKFIGGVSGSVTVTLDEVSQEWRYVLLLVGITLLFLAPAVSKWVPFYYTSSMAIGVFAVVLILLYQGMKLLPTGRKSAFYLSMYTSLLGAGSFLVHYVAVFVNSILSNFGFSQEMQNPVTVFVLLTIILLGAGLGYWLVRKYVISEDGEVDVGVAQFIKWSMRVMAVTCVFLSSNDTPLAMVAVGSCLGLYYMVTSFKWHDSQSNISALRRLVPTHLQSCSTFEVLTACIWRSHAIANQPDLDPEQEMPVIWAVNARKMFNPPLPIGYYGNVLVFPVAFSTARDLCNKPLGYALELLMKVNSSVTKECIRSVSDLMAIKHGFRFISVRSFDVSDVTRLGFDVVDFGWGKPIYGGPVRAALVLPGLSGCYVPYTNNKRESGILIPVALSSELMGKFVKELNNMLVQGNNDELLLLEHKSPTLSKL